MKNRKNILVGGCCCLLATLLLASCGAATTSDAGKESVPSESVPTAGASEDGACVHEAEIDEGIEATCTEGGLSEGSHCAKCGEILVAQEEILSPGHNYENGTCTVCKQKEPSVGLSFQVNNNELAVLGVGSCTDTLVVIPESDNGKYVTLIEDGAFRGNQTIEGVIVPAKVVSIGSEAFKDCAKLQSVILPADVMFLEENAFAGCTALTDIWCEASAKPNTWTAEWLGDCTATIHWGGEWEYVDGVPTLK